MTRQSVVLLHGIWMPGAEMLLLRRRLEKSGEFNCHVYSYPSVKATLQENADLLYEFVRELRLPDLHLVGHSLGGVVALRMLATQLDVPPGRVVCLGSPLCGSQAAAVLVNTSWGKAITGNTLDAGVVREPASEWAGNVTATRDVGVIAGTKAFGMGRIVTKFDGDNDGTVAVAETRLPAARDHICIDVNHTALVTSRVVAEQTATFLRRGNFSPAIR
ncbi:MAG: alpha/beta fold hydrolase [Woeseia sp.]